MEQSSKDLGVPLPPLSARLLLMSPNLCNVLMVTSLSEDAGRVKPGDAATCHHGYYANSSQLDVGSERSAHLCLNTEAGGLLTQVPTPEL